MHLPELYECSWRFPGSSLALVHYFPASQIFVSPVSEQKQWGDEHFAQTRQAGLEKQIVFT